MFTAYVSGMFLTTNFQFLSQLNMENNLTDWSKAEKHSDIKLSLRQFNVKT